MASPVTATMKWDATSKKVRSGSSSWGRFTVQRLIRLILSLAALVLITFAFVSLLPGDPARLSLGPTATAESVAARRMELGLDQPLPVQLLDYISRLFMGDLGQSFTQFTPVSEIVAQRAGTTLTIAALAFVVAVLVSFPFGIGMALIDRSSQRPATVWFVGVTGIIMSVPAFLLAVALSWLFSVVLGWLPIAGVYQPAGYVLPVVALAIGPAAALMRVIRLETMKVLAQDYVRTASSKRMSQARLVLRHVVPNMLPSALAFGGLQLSGLVVGTVLVETIFSIPGLGALLPQSIIESDFPLIQALVLLFGGAVLIINLAVDIALRVVDPRSTIGEG